MALQARAEEVVSASFVHHTVRSATGVCAGQVAFTSASLALVASGDASRPAYCWFANLATSPATITIKAQQVRTSAHRSFSALFGVARHASSSWRSILECKTTA